MCLMPANPDISGIGVRIAIYLQNLFCFFPAFWSIWDARVSDHELQSAETQSTTNLVLAFAILMSCIAQAFTLGLTSYHATIVLSLSWMNNTNAFIYFLLYVHYKCQGSDPKVKPTWSSWLNHIKEHTRPLWGPLAARQSTALGAQGTNYRQVQAEGPSLTEGQADPPAKEGTKKGLKALLKRIALLLGSLHLTLMGALGIWLWSNPRSFGTPDARCAVDAAHLAVVGVRVPFGSESLRVVSLTMYSLFLLPALNLLLPMGIFLWIYIWHNQRIMPRPSSQVAPGTPTHRTPAHLSKIHPLAANSPVLPIFGGLVALLIVNIVFIGDIELTLRRNRALQAAEEAQWGFGQILAVLLILLPLRDVVEMMLARRLNRQWNQALRERNTGMIHALLDDDVDVTVRGQDGVTALQVMASEKEWRTFCDIATAIIRRGESPAKFYDEHASFCRAIADNSLDAIRALIHVNADLNSALHDGKTPLEMAMSSGKWDIVHILVNSKVANTVFQDGQTPLQQASRAERWLAVHALLKSNANFKNLHVDGRTLLRVAADAGEWGVVTTYLEKGASEGDEPDGGRALLALAIRAGAWEVVYRLAGLGAEETPEGCPLAPAAGALRVAFLRRQWQLVELLLEGGADPGAISDDGRTLLEVATRAKAWQVVCSLANANHPVDVMFQDYDGDDIKTALGAACHHKEWEVAELLLDKGADPNIRGGKYGPTPLEEVCAAGHFMVAERLFFREPCTSPQGSRKQTLAPGPQTADTQGHLFIAKTLLDGGIVLDIHERGPALRMACTGGRLDLVHLLLGQDANPNLQAVGSGSALHIACAGGNLDIVQALLDGNADPNIPTYRLGSPLHLACSEGHLEIVSLLLSRGADPDLGVFGIGGPLHRACSRRHLRIVQLLLEKGADPNFGDSKIGVPLHVACSNGHLDIVEVLLDSNADPGIGLPGLGVPLQVACSGRHLDVIKLLLDRRVDPNLGDSDIGGPLHVACSKGHFDVVKLLLDLNADPNIRFGELGTALHVASAKGDLSILKLLLDRNANPNLGAGELGSPFHLACSKDNLDVVKVLLDRGANPNLGTDGSGVRLPLHVACGGGNLDMVKLLLERNANPSLGTDELGVPLHVACSRGHLDVVKHLLDRDPYPNYRSGPFDTGLQAASAGGHLNVVKLLLERGADRGLQGGEYGSALAAARVKGQHEIVWLLINNDAAGLSAPNSGS